METGSRQQPRKHPRHKLANTFIVNKQGVCRVFDLMDNSGTHLPELSMRTVWTAKNQDLNSASIYEIIVGAAFDEDLSPEDQSAFDHLLAAS